MRGSSGRRLREFGDEQAVSSEERSRQIYILEENILHAISKLYVFHIVTESFSFTLSGVVSIQRTNK